MIEVEAPLYFALVGGLTLLSWASAGYLALLLVGRWREARRAAHRPAVSAPEPVGDYRTHLVAEPRPEVIAWWRRAGWRLLRGVRALRRGARALGDFAFDATRAVVEYLGALAVALHGDGR